MHASSSVSADRADGAVTGQVIVLLVVVLALAVTTVLLTRTMAAARNINAKAERIAETGRGINEATDAVIQLTEANRLASSILTTAEPLEGKLAQIVELARAIDQLAASIDDTAGAINRTAGTIGSTARTINTTASGINSQAAAILDVARRIDANVEQINRNLDATIAIAREIKGDTGNILTEAQAAHRHATCIDRQVGGARGTDGHCA